MKLIPCPACEHRVSPEAPFCPGCGHPLDPGNVEFSEPLMVAEAVGEICSECEAPATQKCCDCGSYCCVRHANFISSKRSSGFYCGACAEAKSTRDIGAIIIAVIVGILALAIAAGS